MLAPFGDGNNCVGLVGYADIEQASVRAVEVRGHLAIAKLRYDQAPDGLLVRPAAYGLRKGPREMDRRQPPRRDLGSQARDARHRSHAGRRAAATGARPRRRRLQVRATLAAARDDYRRHAYDRLCTLLSDRADTRVPAAAAMALGDNEQTEIPSRSCAARLEELDLTSQSQAYAGRAGHLRRVDPVNPFALTLPAASRVAAARVTVVGDHASVTIPGKPISPNLAFGRDVKRLIRVRGRWLVDADTLEAQGLSGPEYARCWKRAGAAIATSARDLRFARRATSTFLDIGHCSIKATTG